MRPGARFSLPYIGHAHEVAGVKKFLSHNPAPRCMLANGPKGAKQLLDWVSKRSCQAVMPLFPACESTHNFN